MEFVNKDGGIEHNRIFTRYRKTNISMQVSGKRNDIPDQKPVPRPVPGSNPGPRHIPDLPKLEPKLIPNSKPPLVYNNKLKLAVILHGLAYCEGYYSNHTLKHVDINYKRSLQNYKDMLFKNHDVDIYFHTYNTPNLDKGELINSYKPVKFKITELVNNSTGEDYSNKIGSLKNSFVQSLELLDNDLINQYDYIIVTRFDLLFKKDINSLHLENKFMISCMCEVANLCDDNFFIFPPTYFNTFKEIICNFDLSRRLFHCIYTDLEQKIGKNNIKILFSGKYVICLGTPLYAISRN